MSEDLTAILTSSKPGTTAAMKSIKICDGGPVEHSIPSSSTSRLTTRPSHKPSSAPKETIASACAPKTGHLNCRHAVIDFVVAHENRILRLEPMSELHRDDFRAACNLDATTWLNALFLLGERVFRAQLGSPPGGHTGRPLHAVRGHGGRPLRRDQRLPPKPPPKSGPRNQRATVFPRPARRRAQTG